MSEQNKIDEIKEALAAATPGPWYAEDHKDGTYSVTGKPGYYGHCITGWGRVRQTKGDAHFIAKAPEYITYLLQHVAELKSEMDLVKEELFYEKRASEENHVKFVEQYKLVELLQKEVEFWKLAVDIKKGDNIKLISILHEKDEKAREAINKWETATPEDDFDDIMHAVIDELKDSLAL